MPIVIVLTSASSSPWTVPPDWNNSFNTIECIGEGGNGGNGASSVGNNVAGGGSGGGGAYHVTTSFSPAAITGRAGSAAETIQGVEKGVEGAEGEQRVEKGVAWRGMRADVDDHVADEQAEPADLDRDGFRGQLPGRGSRQRFRAGARDRHWRREPFRRGERVDLCSIAMEGLLRWSRWEKHMRTRRVALTLAVVTPAAILVA